MDPTRRIGDWTRHNALTFPDFAALEDLDTGEVLTWAELDAEVGFAAAALSREGLQPGDRVALLAENDIRTFVLQFALMRLGCVFVPLNWRLAPAELRAQREIVRPALLLHDRQWAVTAQTICGANGPRRRLWPFRGDSGADGSGEIAATDPPPTLGLDGTAQLLFTSGTTGRPKAAAITVESLLWHAANTAQVDDVRGAGDRYLDVLPLFHTGGLNILAMPILIAGGCVSVLRRFDAPRVLRILSRDENPITHFLGVPVMLDQMVASSDFATADLSALRHIQVGAGQPSSTVVRAFARKGIPLQIHYGGTELGPGVSGVPRSMVAAKPGSCGIPFRNTNVRIVGDDGSDVAPGEVGEIYVTGPGIARRYVGGESQQTTDAQGWLHTGDLGRIDSEGYLYLVDRKKDMFKSGGENVYPAEIEAVLVTHPAIEEVAVVAVPHQRWGHVGLAIYVSVDGRDIPGDELTAFCRDAIAGYKVPKRFERLDGLPRNASGKVAKAELRVRFGGTSAVL